jgi:hypothetical protein
MSNTHSSASHWLQDHTSSILKFPALISAAEPLLQSLLTSYWAVLPCLQAKLATLLQLSSKHVDLRAVLADIGVHDVGITSQTVVVAAHLSPLTNLFTHRSLM